MAAEPTLQNIIDGKAPLNSAIGLRNEEIDAIAALAFQAYEQGRAEEAETIFDGLTALDQNLYYGYAGLGAIRLAADKVDQALPLLEKAVELNSQDPTVRANLGEALLRANRVEAAAEQFRQALELDPDQRDAGANRARAILLGMEVVMKELEKARTAGA